MAKTIASLVDGRVTVWFCEEEPIPAKYVVIPDALLAKYKSGEITDGKALAKAALAADSELGVAPQNVATPPPESKTKVGDDDPGSVDPKTIEKGEPSQPEVTHFPHTRTGTMRA